MQSGFERSLVFPGISKADILGDAANAPFFLGLNFKMNPRLTPRIFVQSGFERMLGFPGISKADILGDVENPTFYRAQL